ncbi:MAG TPA: PQQ-binding-like beta-propeller repeat protein, partial [Ignavibacteria bacterium]|nr:PQQ-binding-like beta-propeller repeat protein [Ignavibacteria bacterium]HMR40943.1 PQQ-binding-like beta-propeller repeat protein [Ignavibacteria bacterium]
MNKITKLYFCIILSVFYLSSSAEAQLPHINSISADTLSRSGLLRIFGNGFGIAAGTSRVIIGSQNAIVSRWNDTLISAYVPEQSGPGQLTLKVETSSGMSNTIPLNVTLRQSNGRVRWRFEANVVNLWFRPAIAPDGTIYIHGSDGYVYALTPDGGLKWIHKVNWYPYGPLHAGPDGTVYVCSIQRLTAINPDGTERWQFTDPGSQGINSGPVTGPDGNIYSANNYGLGANSVSSNGQLLWSNPGNPLISWYGGTGAETVLGPSTSGGVIDQMYVVPNPLLETYTLQAFSLSDGSLRFSVPIGGQSYAFGQQQTQPIVGPDGTIFLTHMRAAGGIGWVLEAYSPVDGHSLWYYHGNTVSGMSPPDVGTDGIVYYSQDVSRIVAFNPNTLVPNWQYSDGSLMYHPTVSPLNNMVVTGGVMTFGDVGFIKAISTATGQLLWTVPLPGAFYPVPRVVSVHHPRFTQDGRTVYVSTTLLGGSEIDPSSFIYAIDAEDTPTNIAVNSEINSFKLFGNYPNPFNPVTNLEFEISGLGFVSLKVYNIIGKEIATLVNENLNPGNYK